MCVRVCVRESVCVCHTYLCVCVSYIYTCIGGAADAEGNVSTYT
jgi:hypothetical protein